VRSFVGVLLVALGAGAAAAQEEAPEPPQPRRVVSIRFEGSRRYKDDFLKEQIATKVGDPYDPGRITLDRRELRKFFAAVTDVEESEVDGGVALVFHVVDKLVVGQVILQGLARVKRDDIEPLLATRAGRPLLVHALESDRRLIERLHREKGYRFADVKYYRRRTRKPDVEDVVFQVLPGERVRVLKVILEGARSVRRKELTKIIHNSDRYRRQYLGLGKLLDPSYYDREAINEDRRRMEFYYEREGWLDAKVVYVETRFDAKREYATIKYRIEEGKRYSLRSFEVEYAEGGLPEEPDRAALTVESLEALSELVPGDPFRAEDRNRTRRALSGRLWQKAYARSRIEEVVTRDARTHEVDLKLVVTAGPKIRQGRLIFYGNRYTRDNVLRRQFRAGALPGDYLDIESLEAARNRLIALRFFNFVRFGDGRNWGLVRDPNAPEPDIYDVEVEVEEGDTRQFSLGAGVSTDGGAFGQFSITWRNFDIKKPPDNIFGVLDPEAFRGGGQQFTLTAAPGSTFSTFTIAFSDPAVRDSRWSLGTSFYRRISLFDDYDQTTDGASVRVGRFLDEDYVWNLSFEWQLRQVILDDPSPDAPVNALDVQGASTVHSLGVTLRRVRRREADAFLNGHITTLGGSYAGGFLSGDVDVFKLRFEHRAGWRVFKRPRGWHRVQVSFSTEWARAFDGTSEVPIFERYFLGGRSLRGFEFREVGPRSNDRPTGGEFLLTLSTQYTVPVVDRSEGGFGLDIIFFLDQGGLSTEFSDFGSEDWRISAGFGFAIGFGAPTQPPLIIDFGWPLRDGRGDRRQVVSVAFVRNF